MGFKVERLCYTLQEVAERWGLQVDDLLHMTEQAGLRLAFGTGPRFLTVLAFSDDAERELTPPFSFLIDRPVLLYLIGPRHAMELLFVPQTQPFTAHPAMPHTVEECCGDSSALLLLETTAGNPTSEGSEDVFSWGPPLPKISREGLLVTAEELQRMEEEYPELAAGKGCLQELEARNNKPASSRAERTDLLLVGGLLGLLKEKWKDAKGVEPSDAQVMDALEEWLPGTFKTRTTQDRFTRAKRALDNTE
ncbi:MAG: hypothetical protein Q4G66_11900 [bacterium]|nr:hypothetical protein [bacterium]